MESVETAAAVPGKHDMGHSDKGDFKKTKLTNPKDLDQSTVLIVDRAQTNVPVDKVLFHPSS